MASHSASSHRFQKLKLVTSTSPKPAPSSFASIPRDDASQPSHSRHAPSRARHGTAAQNIVGACHAPSSGAPPYDLAVGSSGSDDDGFNTAQFRQRTTSISFDTEVRLDNGDTVGLELPVPKALSRPSHSHTPESGSYSDHEYLEMPIHHRRPLQHRIGVSRYPLLQATVDSLADDPEYHDQVASLTSDTTASPPLEEARTPLETPSEYALSPLTATSPLEFPGYSPRQTGPGRNRSYRPEIGENACLQRASRRSSNRSGRSLSSMSPAASFLARYKPSETPIKPSEPDDEGQGIGYNSEYIIGKQIGYGGFSIVKEVTSMEDGKPVVNAVKIVRKQQQKKSEFENEQIQTQFDHEVEIWRFLRHPYILPLLRVYTTDFATFCITKLNKGGTLFDLVRHHRRSNKPGLPKHLAKRYTYQLASAMRYLHNDVQVVHRDIKLENCLVDMTGPDAVTEGGDVLLCDFGMADFLVSDQRDGAEPHSINNNQNIGPADTSTSVAGSLQYAAPELFNAPGPVFSTAADIWAFGVVVFAMVTARLPFNEGLDMKTTEKILAGNWDEELVRLSYSAQDEGLEDAMALIRGCLSVDVEKRWMIHDILGCAWLRDYEQRFEGVPRSWLEDN
ncbi:kinase-like domain-containing protein [Ampelomyces quisqualis]|uniref:Kinase-like domain-containing protein n=1 Tax=Ampelomyces quisqualis TaxID=50730 RepID=A0A6A5QZX1_AMPQU|nr:kinase-like domain-containing protein [Ampelomyces quisqualis]